jgi:hypothetical protein
MATRWYREDVIYRLDVWTFQDSDDGGIGDFQALTSRMDRGRGRPVRRRGRGRGRRAARPGPDVGSRRLALDGYGFGRNRLAESHSSVGPRSVRGCQDRDRVTDVLGRHRAGMEER